MEQTKTNSKDFEVTILGVNSAMPTAGRNPSCQVLNYDHTLYMIDCGEGAQIRLLHGGFKGSKIAHIFISHLHGDHCFGLPGLLTSFALNNRTKPLHIYGPPGTREFVKLFLNLTGNYQLPYLLDIHELDTETVHTFILNPSLRVSTFPLKHRVPTMGFRFDEIQSSRNIIAENIEKYQLTIAEIKAAKQGEDIVRNGQHISNSELTLPPLKNRSYAYCSDTVYDVDLVRYIEHVDVLYHETTYLEEHSQLAKERLHSTLEQAISIAKAAKVRYLISGHYSSRYMDISIFDTIGKSLFDGFLLGEEGVTYPIF